MEKTKLTWDEFHEILSVRAPRRMKILREIFNYSQQGIADAMGISQTNYGNLERGAQAIQPEHIRRYCKALDITPDDFFKFDLTEIIAKAKINV
jgi:transcriptional regulator with XRE-family HTH domain